MNDLDDVAFVLNDDVVVTVNGGAGDDGRRGGPGPDSLHGDAGDDALRGGPAADTLDGGTGTATEVDTVDYGSAGANTQVMHDGAANDGAGHRRDHGGHQPGATTSPTPRSSRKAHDDVLTGSANADTLDGNTGTMT